MILEAEDDLEVIGEASDGEQALAAIRQHQPDVVLMDVQMPKLDGLEATRRAGQETTVDSRVVILTTFERDDYVFEALRAGASGFLLKNAPLEELVHAVRIVAAGDALLARPSPGESSPSTRNGRPHPSRIPASIGSPNASPRCYGCWPPARATPSSPSSSTWAKGPSRPTCPTCWPS
jgi:DNA-binding NarL/FixJ family response regulator